VTLPYRAFPRRYTLIKDALNAGAQGNWNAFILFSQEVFRFCDLVSPPLFLELAYITAKGPSSSIERIHQARLASDVARHRLVESQYVPGGVEEVRGFIRGIITNLKRDGFEKFAVDLESQLDQALNARVSPPSASPPPSPPPASPQPEVAISQGTAFAVTADGTFLTAFHVVAEARVINISCQGQEPTQAKLRRVARAADLGLLSADVLTPYYLPLASGRSTKPLRGETSSPLGCLAQWNFMVALTGPGFDDPAILQFDDSIPQMEIPIVMGDNGHALASREQLW
jgi:hypothetical protein